jgi:hypothetical protein
LSFISDLFKGGTAGVFEGAGTFAKNIREAITGQTIVSPDKQAEILLNAQALEASAEKARLDFVQEMAKAQTAINALEAQNSNLFVSGWRPAVGWVCVAGLFYTFLLKPLLPWAINVLHISIVGVLPDVPMADLIVLLSGMLGLSIMRSVDKYNGVTGLPNNKG